MKHTQVSYNNGYSEDRMVLDFDLTIWRLSKRDTSNRLLTVCLIRDGRIDAITETIPRRSNVAVTTWIRVDGDGAYTLHLRGVKYDDINRFKPVLRRYLDESKRLKAKRPIGNEYTLTFVVEKGAPARSLWQVLQVVYPLADEEIEFMSCSDYRALLGSDDQSLGD